ncbi:hypothetical protein D3C73_1304690 [compost metagenome]
MLDGKIQTCTDLYRAGEIQRFEYDPLTAQVGDGHTDKALEPELYVFSVRQMPNQLPGIDSAFEIQLSAVTGEPASGQIQCLSIHRNPGIQPIHRIHHEAQRFDNPFIVGCNLALFKQPVEITPQQAISAVSFFRIAPDPHIFISQ